MLTTRAQEESWPPRSPLKALLSSPSGRRKYRDAQNMATIEPEEDEETLQLQLAAIEAKLKLKKLQQQQKGRQTQEETGTKIEVNLSPIKKREVTQQRSPARVHLGIDKGWTASDVSLKRSPRKATHHVEHISRPLPGSVSVQALPQPVKTFSERMAEMRTKDKTNEEINRINARRKTGFDVDKKELESYRDLPTPPSSSGLQPQTSNTKKLAHSKSTPNLSSAHYREPQNLPHILPPSTSTKGDPDLFEGLSRTHLSKRHLPHTFLKRTLTGEDKTLYTIRDLLKNVHSPDYVLPDGVADFSVLGIIGSTSKPQQTKETRAERNSTKSWHDQWDDGTNNTKKFIALTLTNLDYTVELYLFDTAVPKYHRLAPGTLIAVLNPSIMRPKPGLEDTGRFSLAINNSDDSILEIGTAKYLSYCEAKKANGQPCGQWINGEKTSVCEYHVMQQVSKNLSGRSGLNSHEGHRSYLKSRDVTHLKGEARYKNQSSYSGVDAEAGRYIVVRSSRPVDQPIPGREGPNPYAYGIGRDGTAKLLDSEGAMADRDKAKRVKEKLARMAKEIEIAKQLGKGGTGAGGEYMRKATGLETKQKFGGVRANVVTKEDIVSVRDNHSGEGNRDVSGTTIMSGTSEGKRKREADSVRLSPVKKKMKTRFLTEQGIKFAGKDSIRVGGGVKSSLTTVVDRNSSRVRAGVDEDDDELDII